VHLLYALHQADQITEKPSVAELLVGLAEGQLRQLIIGLAQAQPGIIEAIESQLSRLKTTPITTFAARAARPQLSVDIVAIQREMSKDFRNAGITRHEYDYYSDEGPEFNGEEIFEPHVAGVIELLAAGHLALALEVMLAIVEEWVEGVTELEEYILEYNEDAIYEATESLAASLAEVLLSNELDPEERQQWLVQIEEWNDEIGALDIVETAISQGWDYPPLLSAMAGNITDQGAWEGDPPSYSDALTLVRLRILARQERYREYIHLAEAEGQTSLYLNMLAQTGETAKAVSEAKAYLDVPGEALSLVEGLVNAGKMAEALDVGEHGLSLGQEYERVALARRLRALALEAKETTLALKAAQVAFIASRTLIDYQTVEKLAGSHWSELKIPLLETLNQGWDVHNKVDVFLYEGLLTEAMTAVEAGVYSNELERVVEATREKYPDWGIQQYKGKAERIMDAGKAKYYDDAADWLQKARHIYEQHHRLTEWHQYINLLLDKHQRKYKLAPLLRQLR